MIGYQPNGKHSDYGENDALGADDHWRSSTTSVGMANLGLIGHVSVADVSA